MNIHEYQGKELLAKFGIGIPAGHAALTVEEAVAAAKQLPGPLYVVKAQIHAGGRGKGKFKELPADAKGGVRLAFSLDEVESHAREMLGNTLVTVQTGDAGKQVNRLYITDGVDIEKEYYLAMLVDRATGRLAMVASTEGGMNIEDVAHDTPEKITTITTDPAQGFMAHHGRAVAFALKLEGEQNKQAQKLAKQLYEAFCALECSMLEINPLVETKDGNLLVLDTKMSFDSNAMYRHPDVEALRDITEEDPAEVEASEYDLAYIKLDGDIGCMVNGAGLAMATMDIIKLNGAFPANFLDVGGGASKEKVTAAFKIILADPAVKGILVNIFGGIMKCDTIAEGIVAAAKEVNLSVPLVVRLEGTNVQLGKDILANSGLPIVPANDLGDAAQKIVAEVRKAGVMSPQETVEAFLAAWNRMDFDAAFGMMAEDIVWDNIPMGPVHGIDGARALMEKLPAAEAISFETHNIAANGQMVLTERTDRFLVGGNWRSIRLMGIFEVNAEGKIAHWRDYFDMAEFAKEFGG